MRRGPAPSKALRAMIAAALCASASLAGRCADGSSASASSSGSGGSAGGGGAGGEGGCTAVPEPLYTVTFRAEDGPLPPDFTFSVVWSAGTEPAFSLADPATWASLNEANVVCDLDPKTPPPAAPEALRCEFWTSGATEVRASAAGYEPVERTLAPAQSERCGRVPSDVPITLERRKNEEGGGEPD